MRVAYVRVSTEEQNEARQVEALQKHGIERWFTEKISGKSMDRPKLQEMLDFVREGDVVYVHDFSRLARSTKDLLDIVDKLNSKRVHLISGKENLDTSTATGKLMLTMIGAIAEFERQNMLDRQAEGIAIAKREGRYKGGHPKKIDEKKYAAAYADYMNRRISKVKFAKQIGVSRPTLDRILKERSNDGR